MPSLEDITIMHGEWVSWQAVVGEFKSLGLDVNEDRYTPLIRAIEAWGEELHALRSHQAAEVVERAYDEKNNLADETRTDEARRHLLEVGRGR